MPRKSSTGKVSRLLCDEHLPRRTVHKLAALGHDVITVRQIGANPRGEGFDDQTVFDEAQRMRRIVVTLNSAHFKVIHKNHPGHHGIIACARDDRHERLAKAIDAVLRRRDLDVRAKFLMLNSAKAIRQLRILGELEPL